MKFVNPGHYLVYGGTFLFTLWVVFVEALTEVLIFLFFFELVLKVVLK